MIARDVARVYAGARGSDLFLAKDMVGQVSADVSAAALVLCEMLNH